MPDFLNPYNFIRILDKPNPEPSGDLLWRCPPPPHDRRTGLSGRIKCRLHVETPLFVSDGVAVETDDNGHETHTFFKVEGREVIPGSSLRGPIRSVFEAVTNSTFGVFRGDETLYHRMDPTKALRLTPGVLVLENNEFELLLFKGQDDDAQDTRPAAAWIPSHPNYEKAALSDSRKSKHALVKHEIVHVPDDCKDSLCYAAIRPTGNRDKGWPHWQVDFIHAKHSRVDAWVNKKNKNRTHSFFRYSTVAGFTHITGLNIDLKQYERFFYLVDKDAKGLRVSSSAIEAFNDLMQDYDDRAEEIRNALESQSSEGRSGVKPSTFIGKGVRARHLLTVYADITHGQVQAIYPVAIPRTAYGRVPEDATPEHIRPSTDFNRLSPADRVFGWVAPNVEENASYEKRVAYAGRVRISHATIDMENRTVLHPVTLQTLGSPKPTTYEFYLKHSSNKHDWDTRGTQISGRKAYRHHPQGPAANATSAEQTKFNRTLRDALGKGTEFTFSIEFTNMQPVELGALLWTLQLSDGDFTGYHRIGYGKPLGLGSATINIEELEVLNSRECYSNPFDSLINAPSSNLTDKQAIVDRWIEQFKEAFYQLYRHNGGEDFLSLPNIADIKFLLGTPDIARELPIHYPRTAPDALDKNFEWFMNNRDNNQPHRLQPPTEDKGLPYNV